MRVVPCSIVAALLVCSVAHGAFVPPEDEYAFAVLSDLHVGLSPHQTVLLNEAVDTINAVAADRRIRFVIITGDLTSNALLWQYRLTRRLLDRLKVPYVPILGNHDVWQYTTPTSWESYEEPTPTGDQLFRETFADIFERYNFTRCFETFVDPSLKYNVTYINFEMILPSRSSQKRSLVLYGLDYNTRAAATNPRDYLKGIGPTADLHRWDNGTYYWLMRRLHLLTEDGVGHVVFMHHHPYSATPSFVPDYFSMNSADRDAIRALIGSADIGKDHFWGAIVGHMHYWDDTHSMFPWFRQWYFVMVLLIYSTMDRENTATMAEGGNSISVVEVKDGYVANISRCCGWWSSRAQLYLTLAFGAIAAFLHVVMIGVLFFFLKRKQPFVYLPLSANTVYDGEVFVDAPNAPLWKRMLDICKPSVIGILIFAVSLSAASSVAIVWGPMIYSQTFEAISATLLQSSITSPFALFFGLALALLPKARFSYLKSYFIYGLILLGTCVNDILRFNKRSYWMNDERSYLEFAGPLSLIITEALACFAYFALLRRFASPYPRQISTSSSHLELAHGSNRVSPPISSTFRARALRLLAHTTLLSIPALALELFASLIPAALHRELFPIAWNQYHLIFAATIIGILLSVILYPYAVYYALKNNIHPLILLSIVFGICNLINTGQQMVLRNFSYNEPVWFVAVVAINSGILALSIGSSLLAIEKEF